MSEPKTHAGRILAALNACKLVGIALMELEVTINNVRFVEEYESLKGQSEMANAECDFRAAWLSYRACYEELLKALGEALKTND